jgi:hypothetical protein
MESKAFAPPQEYVCSDQNAKRPAKELEAPRVNRENFGDFLCAPWHFQGFSILSHYAGQTVCRRRECSDKCYGLILIFCAPKRFPTPP